MKHWLSAGLGALLLATFSQTLSAAELSFPWERSWPIVTPAGAAEFGLVVQNEGKEAREIAVSAVRTPPGGQAERLSQTVKLAPGESKRIPWPLTDKELGVWTLSYRLDEQAEQEVRFAFLEPAESRGQKPDFMFGIVSHTDRFKGADRQREMEAAALVGCKVVRTGSGWERIQPQRGEFRWESMDEMTSIAADLGMELEVLLCFTPQWAAPSEMQKSKNWLDWDRAAPDLAAYREFVAAYAGRYKGKVRLWELWNEPDLEGFWHGSTEEYIAMAHAGIEEIRRVAPEAKILSGGFATMTAHRGRALNPDLQERAMKELGSLLDYHAVHEHSTFDNFAQTVDGPILGLRKTLPAPVPPLFFNETAVHSSGSTEEEQARMLVKKASFTRSRGAVGYLWYDLRNDGTDPREPEHNFGLLRQNFEPKAAYAAYNTFAREVVPRPYVRQVEAGPRRWFFEFGDSSEKLLLYWNDDESAQNEQILLRLPGATSARLMDLNGNVKSLELRGGLVVVPSSREPRYLLAPGAEDVLPAEKLASPARAFYAGPGEEVTVACEFTNPLETASEVTVSWEAPSMMKVIAPGVEKVALEPRGKGLSSLRVRVPEGEDYRFGTSGKLRCTYRFAGADYEGSLLIPVHYGTVVVRAEQVDRAPDIVLDRKAQLISFIDADPTLTAERWKGPEELSAQTWLNVEGDDLVLKVAVADDRHFQEEKPSGIWQGDSVQVVLEAPGGEGTWEFGFAVDNKDQPLKAVWTQPAGTEDLLPKLQVAAVSAGEGRTYTARLPLAALGLTKEALREGFRFNLAINDNDGKGRLHALQLAKGLVENKSLDEAPYVVFR